MVALEISRSTSILTSIFLVLLVTCVIKFLNWAWFNPKRLEKMLREQGLHGNPYRLLIGDMGDLTKVTKQEQMRSIQLSDDLMPHAIPYFHQSVSKHGKNSFIWFGPKPMISITEPQLLKEILSKRELFHKVHPEPIGEAIVGGLFYLEDEKWSKHRQIVNPAFRIEKLKNMIPSIALSCSNMADKWDAALVSCNNNSSDKSMEIDVWPYLENLSGDVISRTSFGSSFEQGKRVFDLQHKQLKLILEILPFTFIPGWRHVPTRVNRMLKSYGDEIKSILRNIIEQRKKATESGERIREESDLLSTLIESATRMSVEEAIDECKLFYFAGSETTSALICWTMVMLSRHQEWQGRAREEVVRVLGNDHQPTFDGLNRLRIVNMILLEVLRMYPPVPISTRSPTKTTKIGDIITVPKGVDLLLLMGKLHYDAEIWGNDANEFRPERFSEGVSSAAKDLFSYIPFGAGPRICIGQNLAMLEAKVAMVTILQRFSFGLGSSYVHAPFTILTLRPQHGATLILHKL